MTGEAGFAADQSAALEGIDETLLAVTLALVIVLLLAIYRVADHRARAGVRRRHRVHGRRRRRLRGRKAGLYRATGQATAILIVLMFGAGTDYCLLLLARYREELGKPDAMGIALRRTAPAIVSAGGIVVVVMLVLSSPTTTPRAGWARCSRSAWRSPCSPG